MATVNFTINPTGYGSASYEIIGEGSELYAVVTATPASGKKFVSFEKDGILTYENPYYFEIGEEETVAVTVNFRDLVNYTVTLNKNVIEPTCTMYVNGTLYTDTVTLQEDSLVILSSQTAEPTLFLFRDWTNMSGELLPTDSEGHHTFTLTVDTFINCNFESLWKEVMFSAMPSTGGAITVDDSEHEEDSSGLYHYYKGSTIVCTAYPIESLGYKLTNWLINGTPINTIDRTLEYIINTTANSIDVQAVFSRDTYYVDTVCNPITGGEVIGAGVYLDHSQAVLTAIPSDGYVFKQWAQDGELIPGAIEPTYITEIVDNVIFTAYFEQIEPGTGNKDVILTDEEGDVYPLAHSDSNGEVIIDTYQRKEVNDFKLTTIKDDTPNIQPRSGVWVLGSGSYYIYRLGPESYPEVAFVTESDTPIWDIVVDPNNTDAPYTDQIKYRAWCTTLLTYNGYMDLYSLGAPSDPITLTVSGLNLQQI